MIKVKLNILLKDETEEYIETQMPYLPLENSLLGVWINCKWTILKINSIIHEFDEKNEFLITEINLTDEFYS